MMFGTSPKFFVVRYGEHFTVADYASGLERLSALGMKSFQGEAFQASQLEDWEKNAPGFHRRAEELGLVQEMFVAHFLVHGSTSPVAIQDPSYDGWFDRVLAMVGAFPKLKTICVPTGKYTDDGSMPRQQAKDLLAKRLLGYAKKAQKVGLNFAVEVLNGSLIGIPELAELRKTSGQKNLGINFDTGNANLMLHEDIVKVPAMIPVYGTHLKDNDGVHPNEWKPGDGTINWKELMQALVQSGYEGSYDLELATTEDGEYPASIEYLNQILKENINRRKQMKFSVISSFLGESKDRFNRYNAPKTLAEKFEIASKIEGISALECVFPYEVNDPEETKALMAKYHLGISAINVNVKAEPEFLNGGLTSPDPKVRAKAVQFIKNAKDFAQAVGADKVTCCPLGDGYEFAFQADYEENWNRLVETFGAAAAYKPEVKLYIEFKPSEIRGKCFLDTAAKTVLLIKQIGGKGLGVTMDYGHATYGGCNPAEEISLCHSCGVPFYVHINDNDAKWDWDYFCGAKHIVENLEFVYYLRKYGYNDYLTSDTSPTRWNMIKVFETNNRFTTKMDVILDQMEKDGFEKVLKSSDFMDVWKFVEDHLIK